MSPEEEARYLATLYSTPEQRIEARQIRMGRALQWLTAAVALLAVAVLAHLGNC
jgi:hypothetical protein